MADFISKSTKSLGNAAQKGIQGVGDAANKGLQGIGEGVGTGVNALGDGVGAIEKGVGQGVKGVGNAFEGNDDKAKAEGGAEGQQPTAGEKETRAPKDASASASPSTSGEATAPPQSGGGAGGFNPLNSFGNFLSTAGSTTTSVLGATLSHSEKITSTVLHSSVDFTTTSLSAVGSGVGTVGSMAGTAVGSVVDTAVTTVSKAGKFDPVEVGVMSLNGLQGLAVKGTDTVNGLALGAVGQVTEWTMKAVNTSGITPTFFDPDADGIVHVQDTLRALILLGLDEKNAKYGAYALHGIFSYPTSESWIPSMDTTLPIRVKNMSKTRWGRNWGSYERLEWVSDLDINQFFEQSDKPETWQEKYKKGWQYFGVALTLFEWGTTFPFYLPPLPPAEIPFHKEIGSVVKKVLLPSVIENYNRSKKVREEKGIQSDSDREEKGRPSLEAPSGPGRA